MGLDSMGLFVLLLAIVGVSATQSPLVILFNSINNGRPLSIHAVARLAERTVGDPVRDDALFMPLFDRLDGDRDGFLTLDEFSKAFPQSTGQSPVEQVHLSLAGKGMYVMWVTKQVSGPARVRWGIQGSSLDSISNGTSSTYDAGWGWNKVCVPDDFRVVNLIPSPIQRQFTRLQFPIWKQAKVIHIRSAWREIGRPSTISRLRHQIAQPPLRSLVTKAPCNRSVTLSRHKSPTIVVCSVAMPCMCLGTYPMPGVGFYKVHFFV